MIIINFVRTCLKNKTQYEAEKEIRNTIKKQEGMRFEDLPTSNKSLKDLEK